MQTKAGQRLRARLGRGDGWTALRLDGVIDEHNDLAATIAPLGASGPLLVDLGGVRRINSVGVRDWVLWLRQVRDRFDPVVLFDCPPAIMNEVNLVKNFAEGTLIATFQAPYYCDRCGKEEVHNLDAVAMRRDGVRSAPAFPCGKAACANALDDVEESYFAFFDDQAPLEPPASLEAMLAAARATFADEGGEPITFDGGAPVTPRRPLDSIGRSGGAQANRTSLDRALPPPSPSEDAAPPPRGGGVDFVFVAVLIAMLSMLAVLIYLISTLE